MVNQFSVFKEMMLSAIVKILVSIVLMTGFQTPKRDPVKISSIIRYSNLTLSTNRIIRISPGLFSLLDYDPVLKTPAIMSGDFEGAVITMKTKIRLFGDGPALGKIISVDSYPLEIVGIIKDIPEKSCLYCDLIILSSEKELSVSELTILRCLIIL